MDDETKKLLENHEERLKKLERILKEKPESILKITRGFSFSDKTKKHNLLLKEILKSEYCHQRGGLTQEEILNIFGENGRPVVPKKIKDLLHVWKKRKSIDAIKIKGKKNLKYFWVEHGTKRSN